MMFIVTSFYLLFFFHFNDPDKNFNLFYFLYQLSKLALKVFHVSFDDN